MTGEEAALFPGLMGDHVRVSPPPTPNTSLVLPRTIRSKPPVGAEIDNRLTSTFRMRRSNLEQRNRADGA